MTSSTESPQVTYQYCRDLMALVEVDLIDWGVQLRMWKERLDAEVPKADVT